MCKRTLWSELSTNGRLIVFWHLLGVLWFDYFIMSTISGLKAFRLHYLCGRSDLEPSVRLSFRQSQPCLYTPGA